MESRYVQGSLQFIRRGKTCKTFETIHLPAKVAENLQIITVIILIGGHNEVIKVYFCQGI